MEIWTLDTHYLWYRCVTEKKNFTSDYYNRIFVPLCQVKILNGVNNKITTHFGEKSSL